MRGEHIFSLFSTFFRDEFHTMVRVSKKRLDTAAQACRYSFSWLLTYQISPSFLLSIVVLKVRICKGILPLRPTFTSSSPSALNPLPRNFPTLHAGTSTLLRTALSTALFQAHLLRVRRLPRVPRQRQRSPPKTMTTLICLAQMRRKMQRPNASRRSASRHTRTRRPASQRQSQR